MLSLTLFLSILTLLLLLRLLLKRSTSRHWDHFPGFSSLSSLPVIGHAYKLCPVDPIRSLLLLRKKFGPIFRLDIGSHPTVILCDYDDAVEAYNSRAFLGRPWDDVYAHYKIRGRDPDGNVAGMVTGSGGPWREHRRFMMQSLWEMGGKDRNVLEEIIMEEVSALCQNLKEDQTRQGHVLITHRFLTATNNVAWRLTTGKTTSQKDPELRYLTKCVSDVLQALAPSSVLSLLQQGSEEVCRVMNLLGMRTIVDFGEPLTEMVGREVTMHEADGGGNIIERYLAKIEASAGDPGAFFHEERGRAQMRGGVFDILLAGTDSSAAFLEWSILYLLHYPHLQTTLHSELLLLLNNNNNNPTLSDRPSTPHTMAFMEEVMRHCPQLQLNVPHMTTEDTELRGLRFPRGTQVFVFHGGIHFDERLFQDPEVFRPERFLDEVTGEFRSDDHVTFFGIGKRRCAGEVLARAEMYLALASLVLSFEFLPIEENKERSFGYTSGILFRPKPFSVVLRSRESSS